MSSSLKHHVPAIFLSGILLGLGMKSGVCSDTKVVSTTRVTGMDTLHYASPRPAVRVSVPVDISRMLAVVLEDHLKMPAGAVKIISSLRYTGFKEIDLYGSSIRPDVWFRRFPAEEGGKDGLAVSIRLGCNDLRNMQIELGRSGLQDLPASVLPSCDWLTRFPTGRLETGLMLFLANADGSLEPVHVVPGTFFPLITETMMAQLQQRGVGRPFISPGGYSRNRHMRVVMEEDPDRPLPSDTPGYDNEGTVYGGVLVWTGSGFEIQQEDPPVPATD